MRSLIPPAVAPGALRRAAQPELAAGDVLLRPWRHTDAPALVDAYRDPGIQRWHRKAFDDEADACAWVDDLHDRWRAETGAGWAVVDATTDELLEFFGPTPQRAVAEYRAFCLEEPWREQARPAAAAVT